MNATLTGTEMYQRTEQLLQALCTDLYEREQSVRLALLSAIAGESIFLLGPPGVGKSLIARRLKFAFRDGVSFEYLMSKFSTPDEIFGPVSIKKLKEEDKYERKTERYLPGANVVFLDEIWKAGPSIQNALLTILNEKVYRNGDQDIPVRIRGIITASNELPPRSQNLAPIWDRFLIRLEVGGIKQFKNFVSMITSTEEVYQDPVPKEQKLTEKELQNWDEAIQCVELPEEVLNVIQILKFKIDEYNAKPNHLDNQIAVFDRRWKKIVRLLRTSAFMHGREQVNLMDCFLMEHCLWGKPDQREILQEMIAETIRKHGYSLAINLSMLKKEITDFESDVEEEIKVKHTVSEDHPVLVKDEYYELSKPDQQFEGVLLSTKQFRNLDTANEQVVNLYDAELNLRNRLKAKKGTNAFSVEILHNGISYFYSLKTKKTEKIEYIRKEPHAAVRSFWEQKHSQLVEYVNEQWKKLEQDAPTALQGIRRHLLVDAAQADIVTANHEEVQAALKQLQLRLEKLQFSYQG
ncbi:MAG: AAA family ATPase [Bacteroidota bacterium]